MKSKSFILMILSMGFGLVAAIGISQVMGRSSAPRTKVTKKGPVLVANDHMDHSTLLTEENVRVESWPLEIIPENAATSVEEIKDMAIRTPLSKDLPIMQQHLIHKTKIGSIHIPEGYRVASIKVSEEDNQAGLLKPGDKVDVIGFFKQRNKNGDTRTFSKTFLRSLRVFQVNAEMTAPIGNRTENSSRGSSIVGLLVTERQAEAIFYVQKTGQLKLIMRGNHIDIGDVDTNDEDPLAVFRMMDEPSENADSEQTQAVSTTFTPASQTLSMVVWNGIEPEKVTFKEGSLPHSSLKAQSSHKAAPSFAQEKQERYNAEEDSDNFDESDRGLEEDQYRGE